MSEKKEDKAKKVEANLLYVTSGGAECVELTVDAKVYEDMTQTRKLRMALTSSEQSPCRILYEGKDSHDLTFSVDIGTSLTSLTANPIDDDEDEDDNEEELRSKLHRKRRKVDSTDDVCQECGHELSEDDEGVCPECGTEFDDDDEDEEEEDEDEDEEKDDK